MITKERKKNKKMSRREKMDIKVFLEVLTRL